MLHLSETGMNAGQTLCGREGEKVHAGYHRELVGSVTLCDHCLAIWDGCLLTDEEFEAILARHHVAEVQG